MLPKKKKIKENKTNGKYDIPGDKFIFKDFRNAKEIWKPGVIEKHIGWIIYIMKDPKMTTKGNQNKIRRRYMGDINSQKEEPMNVIYNLFDVPTTFVGPEGKRSSKRKRTVSRTIEINPKRKNTTSRGSNQLKKVDVAE